VVPVMILLANPPIQHVTWICPYCNAERPPGDHDFDRCRWIFKQALIESERSCDTVAPDEAWRGQA